ncbi:hypothetical protein HMPREF1049_1357 [Fusobacterium necrophorum subsp. funduliforme ATCC 51357]|uniref:hypothetical protein n=1 Tax=Fusobacterium necrophorum TaxID=859 RepID=UPI00025E6AFE|nr:hypothetical protein [Fusobacterium necrophorum]EIJ70627.1 hypothetical protein HMPREF1049_1357 [Fusobacterium necrophorum subsp. funduliforme ATCC 51357]KAB0552214.1 hypothetical protein F7P76_08795 [Fusobacterium necrophorum subsp. funduliforme]KYM52850.1 hypothetical protein A2U06_02755 [Fusobacterium necrophorum subsp. funduliforme]KYM59796.1 hypothetical protein A2U09_04945 [Fusobacterium necrophorum subsp. funduliforme]
MRCSYCENEIKEYERFYEINNEFYCEDCVEEQTVTFYKIKDGDEPYHEDEVGCYRNRERYIDNINVYLKYYQSDLDYHSKRSDEISVRRAKELRIKIQKLEEKKRIVLGGDEK